MPPAVPRECPPARDAVRGTGPPRRRGSPRITASPAWWDWASGLGAAQKWPPPSGRGPLTRETPLPPHYASLHPNPSSHQRPLPAEGVALGAITAGAVPVGSGGATDTGVPGVSPPPRIPHARSPMVAATKNAETGRSHNRFPCMVPLPATPTACRTCWSRIPASAHSCFRWRPSNRGVGSAYFRTTYQLFWMSCLSWWVSTVRKPAFSRYSRVFSSPHMAPNPSPPCARDTVMQCMVEIA